MTAMCRIRIIFSDLEILGNAQTTQAQTRNNFPFSNRVRRQVDALTCAYGTEWEADLVRIDLPSPRPRKCSF